jgi:hypothetical protein
MRNLENHDYGRFAPMVNNDEVLINNWVAQTFFSKGSTMIYAGQERCDNNKPSLFDIDKVNWTGKDISPLITRCANIVKDKIFAYGYYDIKITDKEVYYGDFSLDSKRIVGIFNLGKDTGFIKVDIPDGKYKNLITEKDIEIIDSKLELSLEPIIFWV